MAPKCKTLCTVAIVFNVLIATVIVVDLAPYCHLRPDHSTRNSVLHFFWSVCGFFNAPQNVMNKGFETGRLKLCIFRFYDKDSSSSYDL